jgi:TRAP-type uncharacterized transport system substrate-binding protein
MKQHILKAVLIAASVLAMVTVTQAGQTLKMSTIAPGSSAYLTMTTMATMINQAQNEIEIKVDATGAATKHMIDLAEGKIDICMNSPVIYSLMKAKKAMYSKLDNAPELAENLRLLFWFPYGQYHVVTYADAGIKTLKDIRGKKVFLGPPGGGAWNGSKPPPALNPTKTSITSRPAGHRRYRVSRIASSMFTSPAGLHRFPRSYSLR